MIRVTAVNEANAEVVWRGRFDVRRTRVAYRLPPISKSWANANRSLCLAVCEPRSCLNWLTSQQSCWRLVRRNRLIDDAQLAMRISVKVGADPRTANADLRLTCSSASSDLDRRRA